MSKENKIKCTMTMGDDYELWLEADTMDDMVQKIQEWQDLGSHLDTLESLNKKTPDRVQEARDSGWYTIKGGKNA